MSSQKPVASNEIEYINAAQSGSMKSSLKPVTVSEIIVWTSGAKSACTRSIRYFLDPISFFFSPPPPVLLFFSSPYLSNCRGRDVLPLVVFFGDDFTVSLYGLPLLVYKKERRIHTFSLVLFKR